MIEWIFKPVYSLCEGPEDVTSTMILEDKLLGQALPPPATLSERA